MVFSAPGEQKMDFRVHNTTWEPVDLDGIKLMRRPLPSARASKMSEKEDKGISGAKSRAERLYMADRMAKARARKKFQEGFVVLDIETTGTSPEKDEINRSRCVKNRGRHCHRRIFYAYPDKR